MKVWVEPESNHTSKMSVTCSQSAGLATRPARKRSRAPASNQASAPFSAMAARMRAISSSDLAKVADGITSPVSLCWNTVMGTPQARWREITQSGLDSTMPRSRLRPEAGTNSVSSMAASATSRSVRLPVAPAGPLSPLAGRGLG